MTARRDTRTLPAVSPRARARFAAVALRGPTRPTPRAVNIPTATWIGLIVGLVLLVFFVPAVARSVARLDQDRRTFRIVMAAGALKLVAAPLWIYVNDHFYSGVADAYGYSSVGSQVAAQIRHGEFSFHLAHFIGDGATSLITGIVYAIIGSNFLGGFFVFAFIGFVSLVLFYRAFRVALPEGDRLRYAKLVFFFPSLVFWTSAIGKDALISLGLGLGALGAAKILTRQRGGLVLLGCGLALTALIRPHLALMLFAGLAVAYLVSKSRTVSPLNPLVKVLAVVVLVVGGLVLARLTAHFFGVQSLSVSSIQDVLNTNATDTGGVNASQYGSVVATSVSLSPAQHPEGHLLRPHPTTAVPGPRRGPARQLSRERVPRGPPHHVVEASRLGVQGHATPPVPSSRCALLARVDRPVREYREPRHLGEGADLAVAAPSRPRELARGEKGAGDSTEQPRAARRPCAASRCRYRLTEHCRQASNGTDHPVRRRRDHQAAPVEACSAPPGPAPRATGFETFKPPFPGRVCNIAPLGTSVTMRATSRRAAASTRTRTRRPRDSTTPGRNATNETPSYRAQGCRVVTTSLTARLLLANQLRTLHEVDWTVVSGDDYDDPPPGRDSQGRPGPA